MTESQPYRHQLFRDVGITFLTFVGIYVVSSAVAPHSMWTIDEFDGVDRMFLAASELAAAFPMAIFIALAIMGLNRVPSSKHRAWLRLLPLVVVIAYLFSWLNLISTGDFLSIQLVRFFADSPWLVALHIVDQQPMLAIVQLCCLAVVIVGVVWLQVKRDWLHSRYWRIVLTSLPVLIYPMAAIGQFWAGHESELVRTERGLLQTRGSAFVTARADATGPFLYALYGVIRMFSSEMETTTVDDVTVARPPVVDLNAFVARHPMDRRYNVMVILVESLRPDQLKAFGGSRSVMPHLDALAADSYRFLRGYSQATSSNYADLCPLSSQYPLRSYNIELYPKTLPYPKVMIYDVLKKYGYQTAIISSQNENWMGMINFLRSEHLDHFYHSESYTGETIAGDQYFERWAKRNNLSGKIDDKFTVDEILRWTGEHGDAPFFVYANLQNSHVPYHVPDDYPRPFGPDAIDFPLRFGYFPKEKTATVKDLYADSLNYVDAQLGRLFDGLRESGQFDNTIFFISGDTGQAFYEHGVCNHGGPVYDEVVRVPMILKIPGQAGEERHELAEHVDVPPTVLGILGVPPHPSYQGRDLFRSSTPGWVFLTSHLRTRQVGVVHGQHKLIFELGPKKALLFDLKKDPAESVDLSHALPGVAARLSGILGLWYDEQLKYYHSPERMSREYPPQLVFKNDDSRQQSDSP